MSKRVNKRPYGASGRGREWDKKTVWVRVYKDRIRHGLETCRFEGCTTRHDLRLAHIVPWSKGGAGSMDNATIMCTYHDDRIADTVIVGIPSLREEEENAPDDKKWSRVYEDRVRSTWSGLNELRNRLHEEERVKREKEKNEDLS